MRVLHIAHAILAQRLEKAGRGGLDMWHGAHFRHASVASASGGETMRLTKKTW